jgi:hypothetical protein
MRWFHLLRGGGGSSIVAARHRFWASPADLPVDVDAEGSSTPVWPRFEADSSLTRPRFGADSSAWPRFEADSEAAEADLSGLRAGERGALTNPPPVETQRLQLGPGMQTLL